MFDFICGLGQGGGRLAAEFRKGFEAPTVYMNLTHLDFMKMPISDRDLMIIEKGGTGRNPVYGESVVTEDISRVKSFLDNRGINQAQYILVTVGGGGGAGTGFLFPVLEYLTDLGKDVFLVFTLPEKREGIPTKPNALGSLNRLISQYLQKNSRRRISILLIDNDFCLAQYGNASDWDYWGAINSGIVTSLKRFWLLTQLDRFSSFIDMSSGYKALDSNDVRRVMFSKTGYTDLRRMIFVEPRYPELSRYIRNSSLVFKSLDIGTTQKYIVSIGIPSLWKNLNATGTFVSSVFQEITKATRNTPDVLRTSYFNSRLKEMQVSILLTGVSRSSSIDQMIRNTQKDHERLNSNRSISPLNLKKVSK